MARRRVSRFLGAFRSLRQAIAFVAGKAERWTRNWRPSKGSPDGEIISTLQKMRERSRDLYKNDAVAGGLIDLINTHVIGQGIKMQSAIDRDTIRKHLGWPDDDKTTAFFDNLETQIEQTFDDWARSLESDLHGEATFYENQSLAFLSFLQSGEVFVTTPLKQHMMAPYRLRVGLIEADQVQSPLGVPISRLNRDGVETTADGTPIAYWVNRNQEGLPQDLQRIPKFGFKSGRQLIHHLFQRKRPGQSRGVPFLVRMMRKFRTIYKYDIHELTAAEVAAKFTTFITTEGGEKSAQSITGKDLQTGESIKEEGEDLVMDGGAVLELNEGEKIETANPGRPNSNYGPFMEAQFQQIAMGSSVPVELLMRLFKASFSASRASRLEMWKLVIFFRDWFNIRVNQSMYSELIIDEFLSGRIDMPGFNDNHKVHKAYLEAIWTGPSMGLIDPQKEVDAAHQMVKKQFSTMTQMTAELKGNNYERTLKVLSREKRMRKKLGLESELDEPIEGTETVDKAVAKVVDGAMKKANGDSE